MKRTAKYIKKENKKIIALGNEFMNRIDQLSLDLDDSETDLDFEGDPEIMQIINELDELENKVIKWMKDV